MQQQVLTISVFGWRTDTNKFAQIKRGDFEDGEVESFKEIVDNLSDLSEPETITEKHVLFPSKLPEKWWEDENSICIEQLSKLPSIQLHSKPHFIVVDAVKRDGRDEAAIEEEIEAIKKAYVACIVLKVTSVPPEVNLSEEGRLLSFIRDAWGECCKQEKRSIEERSLEKAKQQRRAFWLQTLKTPSGWLSVSNFVLIAAVALSTAFFIAGFNPELLAAAAPALVGTSMVTLAVGALVFPFFAAWKMYEHYNAWRFQMWAEYMNVRYPGLIARYEATIHHAAINHTITHKDYLDENKGNWYHYNGWIEQNQETSLALAEGQHVPEGNKNGLRDEDFQNPAVLQKIGYGYYLLALFSQGWAWGRAHPVQAVLVFVGLAISAALIGFGVEFFLGNELSITLLSPMLDVVNNALSIGLTGLSQMPGLGFLASIFTTYVGHIVGVTLIAALPLIIMDGIRRLADTIWEGQQAGGEPLSIVEEDFKNEYDATMPEGNEDLIARTTAAAFWSEVGDAVVAKYEEWKEPKYKTL